jgi:DNA topoisomerase-1
MAYAEALDEFWGPFSEALKIAKEKAAGGQGQETGETCPECGKPLVIKFSKKLGRKFVGCSGFKEGCKYIKPREGEENKPAAEVTDIMCPNCNKPMLKRFGKRGPFLGCSGYPECKTVMNFGDNGEAKVTVQHTEHACEKCGSPMVLREGRRGPFLGCSGYPKCRNIVNVDANGNPVKPADTGITCEKCSKPMVIKRGPRGPFLSCSGYPGCRNAKPITAELKEKLKDILPPPAPKKEVPPIEVTELCPECNNPLKLRAGRGGSWFLGCSKYPKCRGTSEIPAAMQKQIDEWQAQKQNEPKSEPG